MSLILLLIVFVIFSLKFSKFNWSFEVSAWDCDDSIFTMLILTSLSTFFSETVQNIHAKLFSTERACIYLYFRH